MKYIGVSTPAWTIVGDKKDTQQYSIAPGPGAHQIYSGERATWHAAPKWGIGTGVRNDFNGNPNPGLFHL